MWKARFCESQLNIIQQDRTSIIIGLHDTLYYGTLRVLTCLALQTTLSHAFTSASDCTFSWSADNANNQDMMGIFSSKELSPLYTLHAHDSTLNAEQQHHPHSMAFKILSMTLCTSLTWSIDEAPSQTLDREITQTNKLTGGLDWHARSCLMSTGNVDSPTTKEPTIVEYGDYFQAS